MSEPGIPERWQDPFAILGILTSAKTIAIVGLSPNELRASHFVGFYLRRHGYRIVPVNPREKTILGDLRREFDFHQDPLPPLILPTKPPPGPASHLGG